MLGLYVSDHPLFGLEHVLSAKADAGIAQLTGGERRQRARATARSSRIGGIISGLQRKMTKQGNAWAIATVEDLAGSIEVHVLPGHLPARARPNSSRTPSSFVKGRLDKREDMPQLVAMEREGAGHHAG